MRVMLLSESPLAPSSMGKVAMLLSSGLAAMGYDVSVVVYSQSNLPSPVSFKMVFNPREWASRCGEPLADLFPDADVTVYPWANALDFGSLYYSLSRKPDVLVVYSYPYANPELNDVAYRFFTSKGRPAVAYALHEGPHLDPAMAASVLAYSLVVAPTRYGATQYSTALASLLGVNPEDVGQFLTAIPHPVNTSLYSPDTVARVRRELSLPERILARDCVVSMLAKNHVRKDYRALLEAVLRARAETGKDIAAGLYWVDSVSGNYWSLERLVQQVSSKLGVPREEAEDAVLLLPELWSKLGMSELMVVYAYAFLTDLHLFLTRAESYGLPPVESSLLGVPTATTDIPPQREALGVGARFVSAGTLEQDDYVLWQPDPLDAAKAIVEFIEGKLPAPDRESVAKRHDHARVAESFSDVLELSELTPSPLSSKLKGYAAAAERGARPGAPYYNLLSL